MIKELKNIIISRTDSIGDVILTLPLAKILKSHFPGVFIGFLGKEYTRPVIETCEFVDQFIAVEDFLTNEVLLNNELPQAILHVFPVYKIARRAKELNIPLRIGTKNRLYHWTTCNKLVSLSRKNSDLHEAQLNIKLLTALEIDTNYSLREVEPLFGFTKIKLLPTKFEAFLANDKYNLILHPKSQGSAREWGIDNFLKLIATLDQSKFNILLSGTEKERTSLNELFDKAGNHIKDITGMMNLEEFISFINHCDGMVANSTGPLHIAAILGKDALGIYPAIRPMHPGRWAPVGKNARAFVMKKECSDCSQDPVLCHCIKDILPSQIAYELQQALSFENRKN